MSSKWVFSSLSEDENIELIYCSAVLESYPAQYVFTIKMKSGQLLSFHDHTKFFNLFTELDLVAIKAAKENLNALYEKEDKLYFNEDNEGYNLTKNRSFRKPTYDNKVLQPFMTSKTVNTPISTVAAAVAAEAEAEAEAEMKPSMFKRIKNNCSIQ